MTSSSRPRALLLAVGILALAAFADGPAPGPRSPGALPAAAAPQARLVDFAWIGAVTSHSATVKARLSADSDAVRLVYGTRGDLAGAQATGTVAVSKATVGHRVATFALAGLAAATRYHFAVEVEGRLDEARAGSFRTFAEGPSSFSVALGACANTGSEHSVFDDIRRLAPDLFIHLGDLHYGDIREPGALAAFRDAYQEVLGSTRQGPLFRQTPIAYIWDDHDYGADNGDRNAPTRLAARQAYLENVPHYPLAEPAGGPIHQAFTIGRVRFILTDLRSDRSPALLPDDAAKSMLGPAQKAWFKHELLEAARREQLAVWVNTVPWILPPDPSSDRWSGYATERAELAGFVAEQGIQNLVMVSGDAHMLAIDDGRHSDYAPGGGAAMPVFHVAALDRPGSLKGGPYSHGAFANRSDPDIGRNDGQFGLMQVEDAGGSAICVTWSGLRKPHEGGALVELLRWRRCFPVRSQLTQRIFIPQAALRP